jgi:hypothetical protein
MRRHSVTNTQFLYVGGQMGKYDARLTRQAKNLLLFHAKSTLHYRIAIKAIRSRPERCAKLPYSR